MLKIARPVAISTAPMQAGDVRRPTRDRRLAGATGFAPHTELAEGLARFVAWYRSYHDLPAG